MWSERERESIGGLTRVDPRVTPKPKSEGVEKTLNNDRPFVWLRGPDGAASLTS